MTKEQLTRYTGLYLKTRRLCDELEQLKSEPQPIAKHRLPEIEKEINQTLDEMDMIRAAVGALPDLVEQEVLTLRYLTVSGADLPTWKQVAQQLYGKGGEAELQKVQRLCKTAIKHLEQMA